MRIDRQTFFSYVRNAPFGGRLLQAQIDGMNAILNAFENSGVSDIRWLAYMLATAFHETAKTMQPVRETLASSDAKAIAILDKAYASGKLKVSAPYWRLDKNGKSWLGRGLVQITHLANYLKLSNMIGVDLVAKPSLAMDLETAIKIMFIGMEKGAFTGRKLSDYFNATKEDPTGARAIINGTDKAKLIAGYYANILDALKAALADERPADASAKAAKADDVPLHKSKALQTILATGGTGTALSLVSTAADKGTSFLSVVNNPYALAGFLGVVALLVLLFVLGFLIYTGRIQILRKAG